MCKKIILSCLSIGLIIYTFISAYRTHIPIIDDVNDCNIVVLRYNDGFEQGDYIETEITKFDEQAVLKCISKYNEQRTFEKCRYGAFGGSLNNCEIIIWIHADIHTDNQFKQIYFGKEDYIDSTSDEIKHSIVNSSDLQEELKALILK